MDDKSTNPGSDAARDDDLIDAARQQAEAWTPPGSETETTPAAEGRDVPVRFRDLPSDSFPGFEIVKEVHRGGQGVVYQAVQKATKRRVAIKVMHEGPFAGPRDKARFEREVQILAALKHPNIVAIHDSGTAAGHFFYVMDYISGLPLDQYMASGERSIEETLKLFGKICEAVNAAHLKGVIHRDLKPGNIRIDSKGEPHVLDFGLAKVAMGDMTNDSRPAVMSMTGQFIGSLPWASPEQAEAVPDKIDIRTDVYSLGVILYQMLTGKFPYEVVGNMRDVLDRILKAEPTKPSTIRRQINDEVETIVLKCLQKERERRYQSAGDVGREINRYLLGEPIEAKRDSAMYVLRKQLRRYKAPVAVAVLFVVLLGASTVALSVMYGNQRRETRRADAERAAAVTAKTDSEQAREEALKQRRVADELREEAVRLRDSLAARVRGLLTGPSYINRTGIYVTSVPRGGEVYVRSANRKSDVSILRDQNAQRFQVDMLEFAPGSYEVGVTMKLTDPDLMSLPGFRELLGSIEGDEDSADYQLNRYFVPQGQQRVSLGLLSDQSRVIVMYYTLEVDRDSWTPCTALFLPAALPLSELMPYLPKGKAYGFDEAAVRAELAFFKVPDEDQSFLLDALSRIGMMPYRKDLKAPFQLFWIRLLDGKVSTRPLPNADQKRSQ